MLKTIGDALPRDCIATARSRLWRWTATGKPSQAWLIAAGRTDWLQALAVSILSPLLVSIAFPTLAYSTAALVALTPLFLLWSKMHWRQAFLWGWFSGTLCYLLLLHWMAGTIFEFVGSWSVPLLITVCAVEALAIAAVAIVAALVGAGTFRTRSIFALPAAWMVFESARSYGSLGVPFGALGHVAAHLPWLLPVAGFGGVYLLTTVVALINAAVAAIIGGQRATRKVGLGVLAGVALLIAAADVNRSLIVPPPPIVRVAVAQGDVNQRVKWTPTGFAHALATYSALTHQATERGAKVVVWPETALVSYTLQDPPLLKTVEGLSLRTHAWVISGSLDQPTPGSYYNAVLDITPEGSVGGVYHKRWLMPFAEFLPFEAVLRHVPIFDESAYRYQAGPGPHLLTAGGLQWGTLICYESGYASYARAMANAGADAIIMAADDAWFIGTEEPYEHADVTVIEAASTGRWIARSTQSGISEFVDPKGNVVAHLGLGQRGIVICEIGRGIKTFYDRYGVAWLFVLACLAVVSGLALARRESLQ